MRARSQVVLPLDLEIKIRKEDRVFLTDKICEQLDYTELYNRYLRKWRKIDPSVIFELIVFGYMNGKYSSRDIEEVCYNDIRFMWILQGEPVPDHTTIARFQSKKLEDVMENLQKHFEIMKKFSYKYKKEKIKEIKNVNTNFSRQSSID